MLRPTNAGAATSALFEMKKGRFLSPSGPTKRRPNLYDSFLRKIPLPAGKIAAEKGRWLNASA